MTEVSNSGCKGSLDNRRTREGRTGKQLMTAREQQEWREREGDRMGCRQACSRQSG